MFSIKNLDRGRLWRNWQTRTVEGRVVYRVGSNPTSRTSIEGFQAKFLFLYQSVDLLIKIFYITGIIYDMIRAPYLFVAAHLTSDLFIRKFF